MYVFINVGHLKNFKMGKMGGWSDMVKHRQRASKSKGKGDRKAAASQFYLGRIYSSGDVRVKQDDAEAARWFLLAAENGHAGSQFFMALRYSSGTGVPQDNDEAARCYRMAADQGLACAQFDLGLLYAGETGVQQDDDEAVATGVPRDIAEAARWYRMAAGQGMVEAQINLGLLFADGRGVPRDIAEAARWFHLAAKPGLEGRLRSAADGQDEAPHAQRQGSAPPCYKAPRQCRIEAGQGTAGAQVNLGILFADDGGKCGRTTRHRTTPLARGGGTRNMVHEGGVEALEEAAGVVSPKRKRRQ
jgi:uncharacterized protein